MTSAIDSSILLNMKLLSKTNTKLLKGESFGYLTYGLSLAPGKLSGVNLCAHASEGCLAACLYTAGMGSFSNVQAGRIAKAKLFVSDAKVFIATLEKEIQSAMKQAAKQNKKLAIRLNVVSDIAWEKFGIFQKFPEVQFYDYTKNPVRALAFARGEMPANYHLTFSRSESNQALVESVLNAGGNVAAVFKDLPGTWLGKPVVDGDLNDLRFLDGKNVIVGLVAKGKARKDTSGFVVMA